MHVMSDEEVQRHSIRLMRYTQRHFQLFSHPARFFPWLTALAFPHVSLEYLWPRWRMSSHWPWGKVGGREGSDCFFCALLWIRSGSFRLRRQKMVVTRRVGWEDSHSSPSRISFWDRLSSWVCCTKTVESHPLYAIYLIWEQQWISPQPVCWRTLNWIIVQYAVDCMPYPCFLLFCHVGYVQAVIGMHMKRETHVSANFELNIVLMEY